MITRRQFITRGSAAVAAASMLAQRIPPAEASPLAIYPPRWPDGLYTVTTRPDGSDLYAPDRRELWGFVRDSARSWAPGVVSSIDGGFPAVVAVQITDMVSTLFVGFHRVEGLGHAHLTDRCPGFRGTPLDGSIAGYNWQDLPGMWEPADFEGGSDESSALCYVSWLANRPGTSWKSWRPGYVTESWR